MEIYNIIGHNLKKMDDFRFPVEDVKNTGFIYNRNPRERYYTEGMRLNEKHIQEIRKCSDDIFYFIQNYFSLINKKTQKREKIKLYKWQEEFLKQCADDKKKNKIFAVNVPRQSGKTSIVEILAIAITVIKQNKTSIIISKDDVLAGKTFRECMGFYDDLPFFIKAGVKFIDNNKNGGSLHLGNNSKLICSSDPRGLTINGILLFDEVAYKSDIKYKEMYNALLPALNDQPEAITVLMSTPRGCNHFKKTWDNAKSGKSSAVPVSCLWQDIPGRDKTFKEETIKNYMYVGGMSRAEAQKFWNQEYECMFLSSLQDGYFSNRAIDKIKIKSTVEERFDGMVKIYEKYDPLFMYISIFDPSRNVGESYNSFQILKILPDRTEQILVFKDHEKMTNIKITRIIYDLLIEYGSPYFIGESNQDTLTTSLEMLEYDNFYEEELKSGEYRLGVWMTNNKKILGLNKLNEMLISGYLQINDGECLEELVNYVSARKDNKMSSDMVSGLILYTYFVSTNYYEDIFYGDIRDFYKDKIDELDIIKNNEDADELDFNKKISTIINQPSNFKDNGTIIANL